LFSLPGSHKPLKRLTTNDTNERKGWVSLAMWVRKRLDIAWTDVLHAITACLRPLDRAALVSRIEACWPRDRGILACLSVRTGLDLLLDCLQLPPKSEVLISAVTIRDMVRVVEQHDLVPVPIDLDLSTMAPRAELVRAAVTPSTRLLLVAHLFGGRITLEPIADVAKEHGLFLVEDCAQAFADLAATGHPAADVSMFSFGPIKTATAMGGAIFEVRRPDVLAEMRQRQERLPFQSRADFLRRLLKYSALKGVAPAPVYDVFVRLCRALGKDHDKLVNAMSRGFPGPTFFEQIRRQPSSPLLALLARRLERFRPERVISRAGRGRTMTGLLGDSIRLPGAAMSDPTYWLFPVLAEDPPGIITAFQRAGFDATQGESLYVVPAPSHRPELDPVQAKEIVSKTVFLPVYAGMPDDALKRMAEVVRERCR
jgi:dTDP-4-amino-4,6-dideoxygalactose transaminase